MRRPRKGDREEVRVLVRSPAAPARARQVDIEIGMHAREHRSFLVPRCAHVGSNNIQSGERADDGLEADRTHPVRIRQAAGLPLDSHQNAGVSEQWETSFLHVARLARGFRREPPRGREKSLSSQTAARSSRRDPKRALAGFTGRISAARSGTAATTRRRSRLRAPRNQCGNSRLAAGTHRSWWRKGVRSPSSSGETGRWQLRTRSAPGGSFGRTAGMPNFARRWAATGRVPAPLGTMAEFTSSAPPANCAAWTRRPENESGHVISSPITAKKTAMGHGSRAAGGGR